MRSIARLNVIIIKSVYWLLNMWTANADQDLKKAFDDAIEVAYGNGGSDELENLAKLFGDVALDNYQQALHKGLANGSSAGVDVAWIDKRPIAKLSQAAKGAELGDMMIVVHQSDSRNFHSCRACLLEVKQSPSQEIPPVPVTGGESSKNQFQILSTWPTIFGLKATATNRHYLLENITTQPGPGAGGVLAQAWYVAVKPPAATHPTPEPWMAAPAVEASSFEHTLGDIFTACARGMSLTNSAVGIPIDVGREFQVGKTLQNPPGWDALINSIIWITRQYDLPRYFFRGTPGKRFFPGRRVHHFIGFAGLSVPSIAPSASSEFFVGFITACIAYGLFKFVRSRFRSRRLGFGDAQAKLMEGAFPLLVFRVFHEGEMDGFRPVE